MESAPIHPPLRRQIGLAGAVMMGLGSILGTGVFVSIGIAAGVAGPAVVLAIAAAAVVATFNALSSAQLAANHPVSGGAYEYGYRWLHPGLGFTAGWMFLCAKSASAATAALGLAGYLLNAIGVESSYWLVPVALGMVGGLTLLVASGIRRSNSSNLVVVSVTLASLLTFVVSGLPSALASGTSHLVPFFATSDTSFFPAGNFLQACGLMFVAYTGYGRIATLAEEVHNPRRTIPQAIVITLTLSMLLYMAVGLVGVASVGTEVMSTAGTTRTAPLEVVAHRFNLPGVPLVLAVGAVTAMIGVLLNLLLGISRVVLAMGRRGDAPRLLAIVGGTSATPYPAVLLVGLLISGLVLIGDVKTTWSFSAFTVLIYYAITNLAATRLSASERLYPPLIPWLGLASCLFLAFWVEPAVLITGLGVMAVGWGLHTVVRRRLAHTEA